MESWVGISVISIKMLFYFRNFTQKIDSAIFLWLEKNPFSKLNFGLIKIWLFKVLLPKAHKTTSDVFLHMTHTPPLAIKKCSRPFLDQKYKKSPKIACQLLAQFFLTLLWSTENSVSTPKVWFLDNKSVSTPDSLICVCFS